MEEGKGVSRLYPVSHRFGWAKGNGVMVATNTILLARRHDTAITTVFLELTFVDDGLLLPEVGECGKVLDAILLRESLVVDLDEVYAEGVGVVIYLLEFLENFVAGDAAPSICKLR